MGKDSFVFYKSFYEAIKKLKKSDQLTLYSHICRYALGEKVDVIEGVPAAIFDLIKPQIDANLRRYENGLKGGRPRTEREPKHNQTETKAKRNVNVNENVNVKNCECNFEETKNLDFFSDSLIEKCFDTYEQLCPDLCKIQYARRNRAIRELTAQVLTAIDKDIGVFENICRKANELKQIADKPINYKKMLNCYEGILDGSYLSAEDKTKQENEAAYLRFKAKKEAQRKEQERLNAERGIYQPNY